MIGGSGENPRVWLITPTPNPGCRFCDNSYRRSIRSAGIESTAPGSNLGCISQPGDCVVSKKAP